MTATRWTRRGLAGLGLGLGLSVVAGAAAPRTARAATIGVGALEFSVPDLITPSTEPSQYGAGWQWAGERLGPGRLPTTVVLARADLAATDANEIVSLVLAGSVDGLLPDLVLQPTRSREMPGGGTQARIDVSYTAGGTLTYHGTLLVATRDEPPAALLAVLGTDDLTAGGIEDVLSSARWRA